jgi:DNA-binding MarR family transcriptional regulator
MYMGLLEQQGMVARSADPDDARALRIRVTTRGGDVLTRLMNHRSTTIRDAIAHWSEHDRGALRRLLRQLADDLSQAAEHNTRPATHESAPTEQRMEKS